jgi:hypothetical protein
MIVFDSVTRRDLLSFFVPEWRWEKETPAGTIQGVSHREFCCGNIGTEQISLDNSSLL